MYGRSESQRHIPALDGVRGLAVMGVLLAHSIQMITWVIPPPFKAAINGTAEAGSFGVDLFFVLSGFLITGILLDTKKSADYFRNFYAKRFLRLFPVYYFYLLFTGLLLPVIIRVLHSSMRVYTGSWWWYVFYLANWKAGNGAHDPWLGQFWSLAVEEQFYLIWPTVALLLSRRSLAWLCGWVVVLAFLLRCDLAAHNVYWNVIYRVTVTRFDTLALGALVALAVRSATWKPRVKMWALPLGLSALLCFLGVALYARSFSWTTKPIQTAGSLFIAIAMAALIAHCATSEQGLINQTLKARLLTTYGRYSYGMYVYHPVIFTFASIPELRLLRHVNPSFGILIALPAFAFAQIALFAAAKLSWIYFESPILRYKAKFTERRLTAAGG